MQGFPGMPGFPGMSGLFVGPQAGANPMGMVFEQLGAIPGNAVGRGRHFTISPIDGGAAGYPPFAAASQAGQPGQGGQAGYAGAQAPPPGVEALLQQLGQQLGQQLFEQAHASGRTAPG